MMAVPLFAWQSAPGATVAHRSESLSKRLIQRQQIRYALKELVRIDVMYVNGGLEDGRAAGRDRAGLIRGDPTAVSESCISEEWASERRGGAVACSSSNGL